MDILKQLFDTLSPYLPKLPDILANLIPDLIVALFILWRLQLRHEKKHQDQYRNTMFEQLAFNYLTLATEVAPGFDRHELAFALLDTSAFDSALNAGTLETVIPNPIVRARTLGIFMQIRKTNSLLLALANTFLAQSLEQNQAMPHIPIPLNSPIRTDIQDTVALLGQFFSEDLPDEYQTEPIKTILSYIHPQANPHP